VVRIFSETNYDNFKMTMATADWASVYDECEASSAYDKFHSILTSAFNASFPYKTYPGKE